MYQGQDEDDEVLYVDNDDTLRILRDFIAEKESLRLQGDGPSAPDDKKAAAAGGADEAEQKAARRKQEKRFWERLSQVMSPMHQRIWKSLHGNLGKYLKLLAYRSSLVDDAVNLQKQNEELKHLLDQYLGSKVNEELQVPPTHVIRVVAGGQ